MQTNPLANRSPLALLAAAGLFFISACSAMQEDPRFGFNPQQSAANARQQFGAANPAGSPLTTAQRNLESLGFQCKVLTSPGAGYKTSVVCTLSPIKKKAQPSVTAPAVAVTWMVGIHSTDGIHLSKLVVNRAPQDIGERYSA
ncbi:hypothetical protein FPL06_21400 [Xanthomonas citri pv. glycines]|nr:hypothetical protein BHE84_23230 [Xanthomonas citri pv. glycines str. 8ra]QDR43847.1 hypothetical protein FPK90_03320 [Xanthomonas citri pv. glycines]QDS06035.1 hypothetical protein FPL00_03355 [Xanthomonas citri pv. glycines]QDS10313.1 hypothetical protein FPL03_03305 [Xanthomonas citri pv. glycines]QDS18944.1 hypothetical protein FPL05_03500 [Xanthomonas citri pv. glycines]